MLRSLSLILLGIPIIGLRELTHSLAERFGLFSYLTVKPSAIEDIESEERRKGFIMLEDMIDNDQANRSKEKNLNARCSLEWFEKNIPQWTGGDMSKLQTWHPVSWDKSGPSIIQVNRGISQRVEVWYRVTTSKSHSETIFEKRLDYPRGYDYDSQDAQDDSGSP